MQDEHEGFIGKVNEEQKDNHSGLTSATAASILTPSTSANYKSEHMMFVEKSNAISPKIAAITQKKNIHPDDEKLIHDKEPKYRVYELLYSNPDSKNKARAVQEGDYRHKNYSSLSLTNNDKSYEAEYGFFAKAGPGEATSREYRALERVSEGYLSKEVPSMQKSKTHPTAVEKRINKTYKIMDDRKNQTHSSSNLLPHTTNTLQNKAISRNSDAKYEETQRGGTNVEATELSRKAKQQNLSLFDSSPQKYQKFKEGGNRISRIKPNQDPVSVSSSKLHMVRVLPPKEFIDKMKGNDKTLTNIATSPINRFAEERMDRKTVNLMKLFMDHTDDFELDDKEITDLKLRAKDIEGQLYKSNSVKDGGSKLDGRKPRLSKIILNKMRAAEKISQSKMLNGEEKNYSDNNKAFEIDASYNQIEKMSGGPHIMNSSEQTLQPRFSSLLFGDHQNNQKTSTQKSFFHHPPPMKDDAFARFLRKKPTVDHFSKFRKSSHSKPPPIRTSIPPTSFSCTDFTTDVKRSAGYYADPEADCQVNAYTTLEINRKVNIELYT